MLKITLEVTEKKNTDTCDVKLVTPKDLKKSTDNEQKTGAMVVNAITKALEDLSKIKN